MRCYGDTGTGKTSLAALTVRHLQEHYQLFNCPVMCIFLNGKEKNSQTPELLYGSMLKQLLQLGGSNPIPERLKARYEELNEWGQRLDRVESKKLFKEQIAEYERVYLIVDALKEASEKTRRMVEDELCILCSTRKLSLLITSTYDAKVEKGITCDIHDCATPTKRGGLNLYFRCEICKGGDFDVCSACKLKRKHCFDLSHKLVQHYDRVTVEIYTTSDEIKDYVRSRLNEETPEQALEALREKRKYPKQRPGMTKLARKLEAAPDLKQRIYGEIIRKAGGKFLLAKLYMDSLVDVLTVSDLRSTLDSFPDILPAAVPAPNTEVAKFLRAKILTNSLLLTRKYLRVSVDVTTKGQQKLAPLDKWEEDQLEKNDLSVGNAFWMQYTAKAEQFHKRETLTSNGSPNLEASQRPAQQSRCGSKQHQEYSSSGVPVPKGEEIVSRTRLNKSDNEDPEQMRSRGKSTASGNMGMGTMTHQCLGVDTVSTLVTGHRRSGCCIGRGSTINTFREEMSSISVVGVKGESVER
ncbi:hypothetical protein G7Y89_g5021 [Cudoniella acicularis]|uniref:Nephrocystin 3-like N-terminal domain-containing protein n=1 Tax=Cudoniella acicularis TaxID=354080 RepID=A0A8H4W3R9_9HELO|nr:hypothetical protein G7Y89_g5021 [Cudoniella acicularis]